MVELSVKIDDSRFEEQTMTLDAIRGFVEEDMLRVNKQILAVGGTHVGLIEDIAHHLIESGGKRIRPMLTVLAAKLACYEGNGHVDIAAAIEFIHTATLLHDDVVDESKLRRGLPTANAVWGSKASVLVGDYLLGLGFQLMVRSGSLQVLDILSKASAIIAEGEVMQLISSNDVTIQFQRYIDIVTAKTAALFAASCESAACLANLDKSMRAALRSFGEHLGIAFQIMDDVLDYSARQENLGKTVGDDFREGKVTLPVLLAFQAGNEEEKNFWRRTMEQLDQQEKDLMIALDLIHKHKALDQSVAIAVGFVEKAEEALLVFPATKARKLMLELLSFCVKREY